MTDFDPTLGTEENKTDGFPTNNPDEVRGIKSFGGTFYDFNPLERLTVIHESLSKALDNARSRDDNILTEKESSLLIEFITFSAAELERCTIWILWKELDGNGEEPSIPVDSFFKDKLTQYHRIELLYYIGLIDEGLKGELHAARQLRNNIVHSPYSRLTYHPEDLDKTLKADIDRSLRATKKLHQLF